MDKCKYTDLLLQALTAGIVLFNLWQFGHYADTHLRWVPGLILYGGYAITEVCALYGAIRLANKIVGEQCRRKAQIKEVDQAPAPPAPQPTPNPEPKPLSDADRRRNTLDALKSKQ